MIKYKIGKNPNSWSNGFKKKHKAFNTKPNSGSFKKGQTFPMKGRPNLKLRGEKHYKWKGGAETLNDSLRKSPKWRVW